MLGVEDFTGEIGGMLAAAFAMGAVSGWGFAQRTAVKLANERIAELKDEMSSLKGRITELEDQRFDLARGDK